MPVGGDSKCPGHLESLLLSHCAIMYWLLRTRCYCPNWLDTLKPRDLRDLESPRALSRALATARGSTAQGPRGF